MFFLTDSDLFCMVVIGKKVLSLELLVKFENISDALCHCNSAQNVFKFPNEKVGTIDSDVIAVVLP